MQKKYLKKKWNKQKIGNWHTKFVNIHSTTTTITQKRTKTKQKTASSTSTSSSHQTSRLDSVSPTPESTADNLKAADNAAIHLNNSIGTASSPENSPHAGAEVTPPPYQSAATLLSSVSNNATPDNSNSRAVAAAAEDPCEAATPESPNANTTPVAAAEQNQNAATAETSNTAEEVVVNNKTVSNGTSAAANADEVSSNPRKSLKLTPEQLNGNANINENATATQSTNGNANAASSAAAAAAPTATATATSTDVNNGNTDDANKKTGGKVIEKSPKRHKAQLLNPLNLLRKSRAAATSNKGDNVEKHAASNNDLNTIVDNNNDAQPNVEQNISEKKLAAPVSKNPFEEDEQIYDIPSGEYTPRRRHCATSYEYMLCRSDTIVCFITTLLLLLTSSSFLIHMRLVLRVFEQNKKIKIYEYMYVSQLYRHYCCVDVCKVVPKCRNSFRKDRCIHL
uniref:Uncharacterized protein n=1 Tax=Ceratitis capitata TaxID=7213 RepID=W8B5Z3_CERCA